MRTYQGYLGVSNIENLIHNNNMKTRFLKSTLKGLFLNIKIKSQQEHPLCSPILIFTIYPKLFLVGVTEAITLECDIWNLGTFIFI